jgi:hypothetical protein
LSNRPKKKPRTEVLGRVAFETPCYLVDVASVVVSVVPLELFFAFFLWVFFAVLFMVVSVEFWTLWAAGAATRNGTAKTLKRLDANNFFIVFLLD